MPSPTEAHYSTKPEVTPKRSTPVENDKKGKPKQRKSVCFDGTFVRDLMALGYFARRVGSESSVGVGASHTSHTNPSHRRSLPPISLPITPEHERDRKPKAWRDAGDEVRALFCFEALRTLGTIYSLTLRLSDDVEAAARAQGTQTLDFLHRRVRDSLKRIVGHPVEFVLILEEANGRLHLHGALACADGAYKAVERALKVAGGKVPVDQRKFQLRMRRDPDVRGVGYMLKDVRKAHPLRRQLMKRYRVTRSPHLAKFDGPALSATNRLRSKAEKLHSAAIAEVITFRCARKATLS